MIAVTLLGKSKTRGTTVLHMTFERQKARGHGSIEMHSQTLEID